MPVPGKFNADRMCAFNVLLVVACAALAGWNAKAEGLVAHVDFVIGEVGAAPSEFDLPQGHWLVVRDATASNGLAVEQAGEQTTEGQFPLAVYKPTSLKNAEVSLRLKATGGREDQGGGVAVRLSTPNDYYLVQLDALRNRVLLSLVKHGASEEIAAVDADIASRTWHTLAVRAQDDKFVVSLDGSWMFTGFDKTLSGPGRIALWTTGDSVTRFDQIEIAPLP